MEANKIFNTDILLVGSGASALYFALNAPKLLNITLVTKSAVTDSDSFLAQGGICVLKNENDYEAFYNDTLKAGHYENDKAAVKVMIEDSNNIINDLINYGVSFEKDNNNEFLYTKEGGHSINRILYVKDVTGKAITETLLDCVKNLSNVKIYDYTTLIDILSKDNCCLGGVVKTKNNKISLIKATYTIFATGGIGGLFECSTNFKHLTGDAIAIALKHNIELKDLNYIQVHPTTFYTKNNNERSFLISESCRGEGARLYDKTMHRFVDELLPRDILTKEIIKKIEEDNSCYIYEDLSQIGKNELIDHFPNIVKHCIKMGYDPVNECIPIVPAQHYFMGGIKIDLDGKTSMSHLYAIGETACNGVHGKNRLASNSLLEALVFAKRAAKSINEDNLNLSKNLDKTTFEDLFNHFDLTPYENIDTIKTAYKRAIQNEIDRLNNGEKNIIPYRNEVTYV